MDLYPRRVFREGRSEVNCRFVANPRVLRFPEDSDEIFEAFKEQGFALVEGLISENVLEEVERYV